VSQGTRLNEGVRRGKRVSLLVDGEPIEAYLGETIGSALLAAGRRRLRQTPHTESPRGLFCGMGVCFECLVTVNGRTGVRACSTPVEDGMTVSTHNKTHQQ
jgi:predicted molibdopterin-dependent oxidoreductase YjgC